MLRMRVPGRLGGAAIAVAIGMLATAALAADKTIYIVQLADPPAATLSPGSKVDENSATVQAHVAKLKAAQNAAAASAGISNKIYSYTHTVNGFAAEMTAQQAAKLAKTAGVIAVTKDEKYFPDTATTPAFLGLSGPGGFYATSGVKGENVIIGVIDSGIWPGHPSTSGTGFGAPPAKWTGTCQTGEGFTAADCNNKLIGARFYNAGFGGNVNTKATFPYEHISPKDADGHGTHTTTTSGGNEGVSVAGTPFAAFGAVNGIAPRARVATYKVCWGRTADSPGVAGCYPSDSVAAIEQAIKDGVDVINYSISGTTTNFLDPVETAFRNAATAGVFVAASAGNSGPTLQTVAHPSPWITTVANGTHNRAATATLTLGTPPGTVYTGPSLATTAVPAGTPMIASAAAGLAGAPALAVSECWAAVDNGGVAVLDPVKVAGKIVVCDRGTTARVNKSRAVQEAGGVGMVLVNVVAGTQNADLHSVPSVHLPHTDRAAILAYAGGATPTGAISAAAISMSAAAPFTASSSSRGPSLATGQFDLLKPDIIAPGTDILAGYSPDNGGSLFNMISGTSMSSPHIAGIAALMKQARPTWSPMAIKSALMTTAGDVLDGPNTEPQVIWRQGAGHVNPLRALNPGLVYDSGPSDWKGFLCGQGMLSDPTCPMLTMDGSDLNMASIGVGMIPGSQTVKRRVTNVSGNPQTFTASVTGMSGYTVVVNPSVMTIGAGVTREFTVTFTRTTAPVFSGLTSDFRGGQLTWSNGMTNVRIPIVAVASATTATAPASIAGTGGLLTYKINVGYTGPFSVSPRGLVPSLENTGTASTASSQIFPVVVPAGATYARFSLFDADVAPGSDIDIIVRDPGGVILGTGFNGGSEEEVNLVNPAAGTYTVEVAGFNVPAGTSPFKLHSWVLGSTSNNNMATYSNPAFNVKSGQQVTISVIPLNFALMAGKKYLGAVVYGGNASLPGPTIVRINR